MKTSHHAPPILSFLQGGGEMGALMRAKDWSATPLGSPEDWPLSLRITLSLILNSRFPMFIFWGPLLYCFYNDAYRPSLGNEGKHPNILGMPGAEAWPEIWDIIKPLIDQVMKGEGATWHEDSFIPIFRNGKIEDVYWTFSYSPITDEEWNIGGILVTCTETTAKVLAFKKIEESEKKFRNTVEQAPVGIVILRGRDFVVEMANAFYLELIDKKEENFVGKPLFESLPEVKEAVEPLLASVLDTGIAYTGSEFEIPINRYGRQETTFFNFVYQPLHKDDGAIDGIIVVANEVTSLVKAKHTLEESERTFTQIVMQSPLAITILRGSDLVIELANTELLENIWRKKPEEVIGKKILDVFPELGSQKYPELLDKVYQTGQTHKEKESMTYVESNDGIRKFYLDFEYAPLFHSDGTIFGVMIAVYNVTEQVEARIRLEESEKKFRTLADFMPQHIWTSDAQGNLNYYNQSLYSYAGKSHDELNKMGISQIIHPDDREKNLLAWRESLSTGEPFLTEHRFLRYDGAYRWQLSRALPVKDSNGQIQMWVGSSTDIDEIKKYQQAKDDFIKIASHELKTPVTTIKAYTQLLLNQAIEQQNNTLAKSLATVDRQVNKLTKLIGDLLDVTKIEMGIFHAEKAQFSFAELIRDTVDNIGATTTTHEIVVEDLSDTWVSADKDRISQVLVNLLINAIKYSPGANKVIVRSTESGNDVVVSIQDFGIGMDGREKEKIFERYYRAEQKDLKTFPGFGIGLFIVKEIISKHKGRVWVETVKNKGSIFYFSLPL